MWLIKQVMKFVDIVLPLPLAGTFTYRVPDALQDKIRIGMRVIVPFGARKFYTGIVVLFHSQTPEKYHAKNIIDVLDDEPVLKRPQLQFFEWISAYYMSHLGEVYQAALPAGLKLSSETEVKINPDYEADSILSEREQSILSLLADEEKWTIAAINKILEVSDSMPVIKKLIEKGAIEIDEKVTEKYKPKTTTFVHLTPEYQSEESLRELFDSMSKAPKQLSLLMHYIAISDCLKKSPKEISKKQLLEHTAVSHSVFNALVDKGIFELYQKEIGRLDLADIATQAAFPLNEYQQKALTEVQAQFKEKNVVLLHGVTSSGKTEIYIHLIQKALKEKKQVLYLVPEIALTTQLTTRLQQVFGNKLGVYHSKFSDAERVEIWNNVLHNQTYEVIIGVRSSIFLPFKHLGLVIVDEEHEPSFKQYDPAPRYHARNAAIVLADMHGAKTLLGTATPSIESFYNAEIGKYGYVALNVRHQEIQLPEIEVVDMKEAYRKKQFEGHFSDVLLEKIKATLAQKEQVILFQNRRGYAPYVECKACAYVPKCQHCDVSLTYHAHINTLTCHYCGFSEQLSDKCPSCQTPGMKTRGFGTEQIEEEINKFFPEANVMRMDLDTTRSKKSYQQIIAAMENHHIDILVGTQMVTKGLDFEKVSLVGILNADNLMNYPDFRSHERAFQLLAQVGGRAGRKHKRGTVVIQSSLPDHPVINQVLKNDYAAMYQLQSEERSLFKYPPFYKLIQITVKDKDIQIVNRASRELAIQSQPIFGHRMLGPVIPVISRIQNQYIRQFLLKLENEVSPKKAKEVLEETIQKTLSQHGLKRVRIQIDVDPN